MTPLLHWPAIALLVFFPSITLLLLRYRRAPWSLVFALCAPPLLAALGLAIGSHSPAWRFSTPLLTLVGAAVVLLQPLLIPQFLATRGVTRAALSVCLFSAGLACGGLELRLPSQRLDVAVAIDRSRSAELSPNLASRLTLEWALLRKVMRSEQRLAVVDFAGRAHLTAAPRSAGQLRLVEPTADLLVSATNLEQAVRTSLSVLPSDGSGRLVLVTDGRSTRGSTELALLAARNQSVAIDIVPLTRPELATLRVERVTAPLQVRTGEVFNLRVVLESSQAMVVGYELLANGESVDRGKLGLRGGQDVVHFAVKAGATRLTRYAVRCWAMARAQDQLADDNEAATFVQVRGPSSALVVSAHPTPAVARVLSASDFEVTVSTAERAPQKASAWAAYDLVVLESVPPQRLDEAQLSTLAEAVEDLGTGLLLFATQDGFSGYGSTALEQISPVSFDVAHDQQRGLIALSLLVDSSASMAARVGGKPKLNLAHEAVLASVDTLLPDDQVAVGHVNTQLVWTLPLQPRPATDKLRPLLREVEPLGAGIRADVGFQRAYSILRDSNAHVKHVVLLADADDVEGATAAARLAGEARDKDITTSVVSLGHGQNLRELQRIAHAGGGRHLVVSDINELSSVLVRETLSVSRDPIRNLLIHVEANTTPATRGVDFATAPALGGFVTTLAKPRSTVHLRAPDGSPLLATWSIGLGHMGVFASDYGWSWGAQWSRWPGAGQLMVQLSRLVSRPTAATGLLARAIPGDGRLNLSVDVLGPLPVSDPPMALSARIVAPDGSTQQTALTDRGNGHWASDLALGASGSYIVSLYDQHTGNVRAMAGAEVGIGDELSSSNTDLDSLRRLAERGGGRLLEHVAEAFQTPSRHVRSYQSCLQPMVWLTTVFMLLGLAHSRRRPTSASIAERSSELPKRTAPQAQVHPHYATNTGRREVLTTAEQVLSRRQAQRTRSPQDDR